MLGILQEIRKLYDDDTVNVKKIIVRLIISAPLFPLQILIYLISFGLAYELNPLLVKYLGTTTEATDKLTVNSFWHIFAIAVLIFLTHVLFYTIIFLIVKIKPHFDMLVSLGAVVFIFLGDLKRPFGGGWFFPSWGFSIAWNYTFALILFVIFCGAIILTKYLSFKKYPVRILLSATISLLLGTLISYLIWWSFIVKIINYSSR